MLTRFISIISIAALFASCDGGEKAKMQAELDSLRAVATEGQQVAQALAEVGTLMDSIDANRQLLRVNMVEGTTYSDYTARMKDINNYVKQSQEKVEELEKALKKSKGNANAYAATIKKLKADLEARNKELAEMQARVEELKSENQNLITTVGLQEAELNDKEAQIMANTQ